MGGVNWQGDAERRREEKEEEERRRAEEENRQWGGGGYGGITERRERIRQSKYNNWYKWITGEGLM